MSSLPRWVRSALTCVKGRGRSASYSGWVNTLESPLLTDLYQLTMLQAYYEQDMTATAVFELFVRKLPARREFLVAAGLEQALELLERMRFGPEELDWIERSRLFRPGFAERLAAWRFTGDVHAMPEGTLFFPDEPILRVTAPMPEAQLVETRILNLAALPDRGGLQGGAHSSGRAGQEPHRLRAAPCPRRRGRAARGARGLAGRLRRQRHRAGRAALRHPGVRHHGALVRAGARQRGRRLRALRQGVPRQCRAARGYLRHGGGRAPRGGARPGG